MKYLQTTVNDKIWEICFRIYIFEKVKALGENVLQGKHWFEFREIHSHESV